MITYKDESSGMSGIHAHATQKTFCDAVAQEARQQSHALGTEGKGHAAALSSQGRAHRALVLLDWICLNMDLPVLGFAL